MIHIDQLSFQYPGADFHLQIPSFEVQAGEKVAVIGPSGSGKTTLLNLVAGILTPQQGDVRVGDTRVSALGDGARRDFRIGNVGFVFQDFELLEYLNVLDNVLHPYRITRALRLTPEVRARAIELLQQMGLGDRLRRGVDRLSQGEKQRVAICRALLPAPRLVDSLTMAIPFSNQEKQLLLETVDASARIDAFKSLIDGEFDLPDSVTRH